MLYNKNTYRIQQQLTNWVRTGLNADVQGTVFEGMKQYRRLFRNNIANNLQQAFPIAFKVLETTQWDTLVNDFFAKHDAQTPHIWKLPFEFFQFVKHNNYIVNFDLPFLNDLLYFEWTEIEVYTMQDIAPEPYKNTGELLNSKIEVNQEHRLINLKYPVHIYASKIAVKNIGEYYLLTYRMPKTFEVKFVNLPALHTLFFEKITIEKMTTVEIIKEITTENPQVDEQKLSQNIQEFIKKMMLERVFLGYSETYHN
jgi:hypothetical protein